MDGHFVPNISFGYSVLKDVSKVTDLYLDVHLMISQPMKYAGNFIDSKASSITFHYEAIEENKINDEFINYLKEHQVAAGISIKPDTDISVLKPYLKIFGSYFSDVQLSQDLVVKNLMIAHWLKLPGLQR